MERRPLLIDTKPVAVVERRKVSTVEAPAVGRPLQRHEPNATKLFNAKRRATYLAARGEGWSQYGAAKAAGISYAEVKRTLAEDEMFRELDDLALNRGVDVFEDVARKRAIDGWEEPFFYRGSPVGTVRRYDNTLLMQRLNAYRPERYRQNVKLEADLGSTFRAAMAAAVRGVTDGTARGESPAVPGLRHPPIH